MPNLDWVHFGSIGTEKISSKVIIKNRLTIIIVVILWKKLSPLLLWLLFFLWQEDKKIHLSVKNESFGRKDYDEFFSNVSNVYNSKFCILGFGPIAETLLKVLYPLADQINIVSRKKEIFLDYLFLIILKLIMQ